MLKAIIFDMDGVIIDSEPSHAKVALNVYKAHGIDADIDYCKSFIGSSTKKMCEDSIKKFSMNISSEDLLAEMNAEKKRLAATEGYPPLPGVKELIKKLYSAGYHLAIASSSSITEIEDVVKSLNIKKYFTKLISS